MIIIFSYFTYFSYFSLEEKNLKVTGHNQNRSKINLLTGGVDNFNYFSWFSVILFFNQNHPWKRNRNYFFCHFIQVYNGLENKCTMWRMTFLLSCIFNCSQLDFFFYYNKCGHRNVLSKRQVWMSIFHIINFKKKSRTPGSTIFF